MIDEKEALNELHDLDYKIKTLSEKQTSDSMVKLESTITQLGTSNDYKISLYLEPINQFDLKNIEKVIYVLHPTFEPNKIAVSNTNEKFNLDIMAWGSFHVMAIVVYRNGEVSKLIKLLLVEQQKK